MYRKYNLYQVDAFTKEKFRGNPAGVVTNADGLTESEMQQIAREMNNSETAFIFSSDNDAYNVYLRFFTPTNEVPICGHATIAAHYAKAMEKSMHSARIRQKTGAGILPVDVRFEGNDYTITMTQGKPEFGSVIEDVERNDILSSLGLCKNDILPQCPVQIVSTGHSKVILGIKNIEVLNSLIPDYSALSKISSKLKCNGYYIFTLDYSGSTLVHGRMFAPAIGINEDPVTGNANGPLGAYLVHHRLAAHNGSLFSFTAAQGEAIGREGRIKVEVDIEKEEPVAVRIEGEAVIVYKTELLL